MDADTGRLVPSVTFDLGLRILERTFGRGGIVGYHGVREAAFLPSTHIAPSALRAQLEFLASEYHVLPLTELVGRRRAGRSLRGCAAVTFDDAYSGILVHARSILEQLGLPATVFVATSFCSRGKRFWWDRFEWVRHKLDTDQRTRLLRSIGLGAHAADHEVRDRVLTSFRGALPHGLDRELRRAEAHLGTVTERAMSESELQQLARCDLVDFGCHTAHHYALPWLPGARVEHEVRRSHDWLRHRLPRVRPYLAYPYGMHVRATEHAAQRAGMEAAFSISGRGATSRFSMYSCPRVAMADVNTLRGLRRRLAWVAGPILTFRSRRWMAERAS